MKIRIRTADMQEALKQCTRDYIASKYGVYVDIENLYDFSIDNLEVALRVYTYAEKKAESDTSKILPH